MLNFKKKVMSIDLRKCKPGDILISKHGMELTYVKMS